jgi:hypothetical protein
MERAAEHRTSLSESPVSSADENSIFSRPSASCEVSDSHRYWLANLVFVAPTRNGAIILDLSRNRYLGVGQNETRALEQVVEDWPVRSVNLKKPPNRYIANSELIDSLSSIGLIRLGTHEPCAIPKTSICLDGELIAIGDEIDATANVCIGHVLVFLYALISSSLALRFRSISSIIQHIHARRATAARIGNDFDWRRATELVSIFRRIRPYAFVAGGNCLLHALTLVRFLAHYDEFPQLVLGVKVDPWGAHSWVQHGNFLLDTNPEKVCGFTAILAV